MKLCNILKFECGNPEEFGFSAAYFFDLVKDRVYFVESVEEALKLREKGVLVCVKGYPMNLELIRGFEGKESLLLLDLSEIIKSSGGRRASVIKRMKNFVRLCKKYKVGFALASFCEKQKEMRSSDELVHIGFLLGLNREESRGALGKIKGILE